MTFRLADSLPESVVRSWKFERLNILKTAEQLNRPLTLAEERRLDKLFSETVEAYWTPVQVSAGCTEMTLRQ